jgi:hypothetical protein
MQYQTIKLADDVLGLGKAGQSIKLALSPSDVSISEEIDTYMGGFAPFEFRADEASPPILVDKDTDQFRNFGSNNAFRRVDVETSRQAKVNEVDPTSTLSSYTVKERALGSFVPRATEDNAAPLYQPRLAAARRIRWALDLDREFRVWAALTLTTNWPAANQETLGAGFQWNEGASSNPIKDLQARIEASAQAVTDIFMNPQVAHAFLRNEKVRDHMRQMLGDGAPVPGVAAGAGAAARVDFVIPGLPPIRVVPGKVLNESTSVLDFLLTDTVVLVGKPPTSVPTSGMDIMTHGTWRRRGTSGTGFQSREFFVDERGLEGGTMLVAGHAEDPVFIANTVGGIIVNIIQ